MEVLINWAAECPQGKACVVCLLLSSVPGPGSWHQIFWGKHGLKGPVSL